MRFRVLLLIFAAGVARAEPPPSAVVYPLQKLPLSFSHQQHLAISGVGCGTCHEDAARSRRAADRNIPPESACAACHEIERDKPDKQVAAGEPDAQCISCHPEPTGAGRVLVPTPNLKFNHEVHATRGVRCVVCHQDMASVNLATRAQLPKMPLCLTCHDGKQAPSACTTCHLDGEAGRIRTAFPDGLLLPSGVLRGDAHDLRFRQDHAAVAANDEKYCASCHSRTYCVDCHNGVTKPMDFHGNDYVSIHPIEARRANLDCGSCHRLQTFCTGCHARMGVSDDQKTTGYEHERGRSEDQPPITRRFHPEGWLTTTGARQGHDHSFEAQRNIRACASCHRESFCMECHANGLSPHPTGWATSTRCKSLLSRSGRMCLRCHMDVTQAQCN